MKREARGRNRCISKRKEAEIDIQAEEEQRQNLKYK
jgi:hypothetical protein